MLKALFMGAFYMLEKQKSLHHRRVLIATTSSIIAVTNDITAMITSTIVTSPFLGTQFRNKSLQETSPCDRPRKVHRSIMGKYL